MAPVTTRADVNRLAAAQRQVVALATEQLRAVYESLDLSDPMAAQAEILDLMPELTARYGRLAAVAAAEWYEQVRADAVGGRYAAELADDLPAAQVQGSTRWAAGHLFTDDPAQFVTAMSGPLSRYVMYGGRSTVARNAAHDPRHPRYARVPTGAKTCAFCEMVASRGFVYRTDKTAGLSSEYHDDCDCQVVPEWDRAQHHIAGYDPDAMYARYLDARSATGLKVPSTADILAQMRRLNPDLYSDGVQPAAA